MIETKDTKRSLLIPKWLSVQTSPIDEFVYSKREGLVDVSKEVSLLKIDYSNFEADPNLTKAAELLHASIVLNEPEMSRKAAKYIISKSSIDEPLLKLAQEVLQIDTKSVSRLSTNNQISLFKKKLRQFPRDPLLWTDLARAYTINNQPTKAEKAIITAFTLAPSNRFVARAASRYFVHIDRPDLAIQILRRAYMLNPDPMILSTLTNCSIIVSNPPKEFRKPSLELPEHSLKQFSELLATAAILEMRAGNNRKAKQFFKKGWISPTENVIAHAEWVSRNQYPGIQVENYLNFDRSAEASTWRKYFSLQLKDAIEMATKWSLEEPYSTHPFTCGSSIACDAGEYQNAIKFAKVGLIANPKDLLLLNNLAFAFLKSNQIDKAEELLKLIPLNINDFLLSTTVEATRGYLYFKRSNIELGRFSYLKAINNLRAERKENSIARAMLFHAIAEQEANTDMASNFIKEALQESERFIDDPRISLPREKLLTKKRSFM